MWRSLLRAAVTTSHSPNLSHATASIVGLCRYYSAKPSKSSLAKVKKKTKGDSKSDDMGGGGSSAELDADLEGQQLRFRMLAKDDKDKSLDVGPNGRPLFTSTPSLSQLTRKDACSYMKFSMGDLNAVLPEGLPSGMLKEFEDSKRSIAYPSGLSGSP
uniref:Uncharacterized protein n=1 Tax=Opuntia streptacantha TaxID=393608 RepID=A0A7C9AVF1_OPUST